MWASATARLTILAQPYEIHLDFGTAGSPLAAGYTRVTEATKYSAATSYGWVSDSVASRDRGGASGDLKRDFCFGGDLTFQIDIPNGSHDVTLTMGDSSFQHDRMGVFFDGVQADEITTAAGQFAVKTYPVNVTQGKLSIRFKDMGGTDTAAVVNGIDIGGTPGLVITAQTLPDAVVGSDFSAQIVVTGGSGQYKFTAISGVPPGLSLSQSGLLAGIPTQTGVFSFSFSVSDMNLVLKTANGLFIIPVASNAPAAPSNVVAAELTSSSARITWTDNATNETGYTIRRLADDGVTVLQEFSLPVNSVTYDDSGLTPGATYYWSVSATGSPASSSFVRSNSLTMSGGGSAPGAPSNLVATAAGQNQINLTWDLADNLDTGIHVEKSVGDNLHFIEIDTTAAHAVSYSATALSPGITYYFRVRASNDVGNSAYSNEANATTDAGSGDAFGLTVGVTHPRTMFNTPETLAAAQAWWATNSFVPSGTSHAAYFDWAFAYLMTSNATYLNTIRTFLQTWFMNWAYQGTAGKKTAPDAQVSVGPYAAGMVAVASDTYRWTPEVLVMLDWCWNGWTAQEKDQFVNGYTTTWNGGGVHQGETVTVPGFSTLVSVFMASTAVGITNTGSNYFWGYWRNEVSWALTIYHEYPTFAQQILQFALGATNSRLSNFMDFYNTGDAAGGLLTEGAEYGVVMVDYPIIPLKSLRNYGRDLFLETTWYRDAVRHLLHALSPQATKDSTTLSYWQLFVWADDENSYGYPNADNDSLRRWMKFYCGLFPATDEGKYARHWLTFTGTKAIDKWLQSCDPGGTAVDWRTQNLPLDYHYPGLDWVVTRTAWDGNESYLHIQGKQQLSGHVHEDQGNFEIIRKNRVLCKESSEYSMNFPGVCMNCRVTANQTPTTTTFSGDMLPTTANAYATWRLRFWTGANAGYDGTVSAFDQTLGKWTVTPALSFAPAVGDEFTINQPFLNGKYAPSHSLVTLAMSRYATEGFRLSTLKPKASFYTSAAGYLAIGYDVTSLYRGINSPTRGEAVPDFVTFISREFYWCRTLETLVILDKMQTKDFGNPYFPTWAAAAMPSHCLFHMRNVPVQDGANKLLHTWDTQALRIVTLLPATPRYHVTSMTDFTGGHNSAGWYQQRLEVQDSGASLRYFLHALQARESTEADIAASISSEDASTWTIGLSHATKGGATLVLNKGATISEGAVTII